MYIHILNDCHIPSMWYPNLSKIVLSPCPVCIHVRVHASNFKLKQDRLQERKKERKKKKTS